MGRLILSSPAAPGAAGAQASWIEEGVPETTPAAISAAATLVENDSGALFVIDQSTGYAITLPAPTTVGLEFTFMIGTAGSLVSLETPSGSFIGVLTLSASVITAAQAKVNFTATAVEGDYVVVKSTGSKWLAMGASSVAAGLSATA